MLHSESHSALALVVPLSFSEAESYKYARKYLVENFSHIWAIAIDADARTGIRGDSLFHTMQGRAVILLTRKFGEDTPVSEIRYVDMSRARRAEKMTLLEADMEGIMASFEQFPVTDTTYSFMPSKPFNEDLYVQFWPVSNGTGGGIFLNQCSGSKMAPIAISHYMTIQYHSATPTSANPSCPVITTLLYPMAQWMMMAFPSSSQPAKIPIWLSSA